MGKKIGCCSLKDLSVETPKSENINMSSKTASILVAVFIVLLAFHGSQATTSVAIPVNATASVQMMSMVSGNATGDNSTAEPSAGPTSTASSLLPAISCLVFVGMVRLAL